MSIVLLDRSGMESDGVGGKYRRFPVWGAQRIEYRPGAVPKAGQSIVTAAQGGSTLGLVAELIVAKIHAESK